MLMVAASRGVYPRRQHGLSPSLLLTLVGLVLGLGSIPQGVLAQNPFLGSISWTAFGFIPKGYAPCNGALLPINQNQPLFALLGTTYGGNGMTTFALPNIQSRTILHAGSGHTLGSTGGEASHTLTSAEMVSHQHTITATKGGSLSSSGQASIPYDGTDFVAPSPTSIFTDPAGAGVAHENEQPTLVLSCVIALQGVFPAA